MSACDRFCHSLLLGRSLSFRSAAGEPWAPTGFPAANSGPGRDGLTCEGEADIDPHGPDRT